MSEAARHGVEDLARRVIDACRARGLMLATAESCTGGLLGGAITSIAGSSDIYDRGFVTYSYAAKEAMLGVPAALIRDKGAVSAEVARAMAEGALARSATAVAIAVTGVAGPGSDSQAKPAGLVHIACAQKGRPTAHEEHRFGDIGRVAVREASVIAALRLLLTMVERD